MPGKLSEEGVDGVELVAVVLERTEEVALPDVEGADEEGEDEDEDASLARMRGAHSSKSDSPRNFRAIGVEESGDGCAGAWRVFIQVRVRTSIGSMA